MKARMLMAKTGRKFYVKDNSKDYHCQYGFVTKKDLKKKSGAVKTNTGEPLFIFEPSFIDLYRRIKRDAQIVSRKDIGIILAETGISRKSVVLDAGAGSGALCCFLANIAKKVIAYEIRQDFINIVQDNIKMLGLKNIQVRNKDIYQGIEEKNLDMITLDLPEPWKVISHAAKALRPGGFLISYSPTMPQSTDFVNEILKKGDFVHIKTVELIERDWEIVERKVRPRSRMIGHTGFLTFCRRV